MNQITLATLPQATPEQVFEQVARHLLKQLQKSQSYINGRCAYRGAQGMTCAAGCLIDDSEYRRHWELRSWTSLAEAGDDGWELAAAPEQYAHFIFKRRKT